MSTEKQQLTIEDVSYCDGIVSVGKSHFSGTEEDAQAMRDYLAVNCVSNDFTSINEAVNAVWPEG